MTNKEIAKTIFDACSIATALRAKGDFKGARELLDRVAEILDRMLCLRERMERNENNDRKGKTEVK